jgi:serine/threonine protein kinase
MSLPPPRIFGRYADRGRDPKALKMFIDEARLAARIRHPNVVPSLDVVAVENARELLIVMEYVHGEALSRLLGAARGGARPIAPDVSSALLCGVLHGLHAAHEARTSAANRS